MSPLLSLCRGLCAPFVLLAATGSSLSGQGLVGEGPRLGPIESRLTQVEVESGALSLRDLRRAGLKIFTTPFNQFDGVGDGPMDPLDPTSPGGRPTLGGNGTVLRVNGLDSQTCLECHGLLSNAMVPATPGIGGFGATNNVAMFMTRDIDVDDSAGNGFAFFDGRLIVPPHLYGTGGVQLLAREMTADLQSLAALALQNPGTVVPLESKGVQFGSIVADVWGDLDTSNVVGVDPDLVVKPFGRKGEFATVRQFDQGAMQFHFGMQPVEIVGADVDADGDGVANEILIGELSALEIFVTTQDRPVQDPLDDASSLGSELFDQIGCVVCHRRELETDSRVLSYSFPEVNTDPWANVFYEADLSARPARFEKSDSGGLRVRLFSDLKRHDMGDALAESFHGAGAQRNREFVTAKLWGVADSSPYLHDGRAQTLDKAIRFHAGEALGARAAYAALTPEEQSALLAFLRTLRTPRRPNRDVAPHVAERPQNPLDQDEDDEEDHDDARRRGRLGASP